MGFALARVTFCRTVPQGAKLTSTDSVRLQWRGHYGTLSGYGMAGYDHLMALHRAGVALDIRLTDDADLTKVPERFRELSQFVNSRPDHWPSHVVAHSVPSGAIQHASQLMSNDAKRILLTTWETSKLPPTLAGEATADVFKLYDKVIVPSAWNWVAFVNAGIHHTQILPHTFDPKWWFIDKQIRHPDFSFSFDPELSEEQFQARVAAQYTDAPYTYYWIGSWADERKNALGVLKAYLTTFNSKDRVLLKMVVSSLNQEDVDALVRSLGLYDLPAVEFLGYNPRLTDEQMRDLHVNADCYVTLSRGEGWGLGAFEAALTGNSVIAPAHGSFPDFLVPYAEAFFVCCHETPAACPPVKTATKIQIGQLTFRPIVTNNSQGVQGDQLWAEPSIDHCRQMLRLTYESCFPINRTESHQVLTDLFSYDTIGHRFKRILENV